MMRLASWSGDEASVARPPSEYEYPAMRKLTPIGVLT